MFKTWCVRQLNLESWALKITKDLLFTSWKWDDFGVCFHSDLVSIQQRKQMLSPVEIFLLGRRHPTKENTRSYIMSKVTCERRALSVQVNQWAHCKKRDLIENSFIMVCSFIFKSVGPQHRERHRSLSWNKVWLNPFAYFACIFSGPQTLFSGLDTRHFLTARIV